MKTIIKKIALVVTLFFVIIHVWSQNEPTSRIPLLGETAPAFTAESTNGTIVFPDDYGSKWKIIFSHPADFTPVCTSELMELAIMQQEFKNLNVALLVVSTDDLDKHKVWIKSMEEMLNKNNNHINFKFPLIDDSKLGIGWKYGMLTSAVNSRNSVRGVFIIDPQNIIQSIFFYPKNVGRNMDEIKRTVIALQTAQKYTVLTPVNWNQGDDVLLPYPKSYTYYDATGIKSTTDLSGYMLYKKLDK